MNQLRALVSDIELCAYLDNEIPADRRAEIEAWLARQPEARAKLETWRQQGQMLRASFGRIAQEPLPRQMMATLSNETDPVKIRAIPRALPAPSPTAASRVEPALRASVAPPEKGVWRKIGLAVLCLSAAAGVLASGALQKIGALPEPQVVITTAPGYGLTRHAAEAHVAFAPRAERVLDVRSADAAVLTAAAVQAGLDARLPGQPTGLRTLGLRLTPGEGGLAGLVLFDSEKFGPVSLFVARGNRGGAPGIVLRETNGLTVASFMVDGAAYALTGGAPRDQMVDWASALRTSLVQPRSLRGS